MVGWVQFGVILLFLILLYRRLPSPRLVDQNLRELFDRLESSMRKQEAILGKLSSLRREMAPVPVLWILPPKNPGGSWQIVNYGSGPALSLVYRTWAWSPDSGKSDEQGGSVASILPAGYESDLGAEISALIDNGVRRFTPLPNTLNDAARKALLQADCEFVVRLEYESVTGTRYSTVSRWSETDNKITFQH